MELPASPSLSFAFLVGTAFGDLLAGRFPLPFVSPRGGGRRSGRLFVKVVPEAKVTFFFFAGIFFQHGDNLKR